MHAKFERLLSKSLTTLEVMVYYLVVHTGPGLQAGGGFFLHVPQLGLGGGRRRNGSGWRGGGGGGIVLVRFLRACNNNNNRIQSSNLRFFYNLLTAPRIVSNTHVQVARAQSCPNHVQHTERLSRATCRITCHVVRRDSSAMKFDRVEIAFI